MKGIQYKIIIFIAIHILQTGIIVGQDVQFSQFYTANIYQNPAFVGSTHYSRAMAHARSQWRGLDKYSNVNGGKFMTYFAGFDTYLKDYKSGLGGYLFYDQIGTDRIVSKQATLMYSYEVNVNNRFTFRPGLQLGIANRSYDYQNLLFPRELSDDGVISNSYNLNEGTQKNYLDVGTGFLFYDSDFWVGFSAKHLNNPNIASFGISRLPLIYDLTAGYKFILHTKNTLNYRTGTSTEFSITPTAHYKFQGKTDQIDFGVYGIYDWFLAGVWYRGIPFKKYKDFKYVNNESMVAQVGFRWDRYTFNYSYDFVVSKLGGIRQTGGSHEINITYIFKPHIRLASSKPTKRLPCPDFERNILQEDAEQPSPGAGH